MYGLFGKLTAQAGKGDELADLLLEAADGLREMDDCLLYVVNRSPGEPDSVWVFEAWRTQEAHRASLTVDSVRAVIERGRPLIADMSERVELRPAGGKGVEPS